METKICTKCGIEKDLDEFGYKDKTNNRIHHWCKICVNRISKEYRKNNPGSHKMWRDKNNEELKEYKRAYYKINKHHICNMNHKYNEKRNETRRKKYHTDPPI